MYSYHKNHDGLCHALHFAPGNLKNDREIVLEAMKSYGYALEWASRRLKNDRELVLEAVTNESGVFDMHLKLSQLTENLSSRL